MSETQLRVLSLNCWGLKYVAKNRPERIAAIARALASSSHDIVALQEIWVSADYALVRNSVASRLPYAKYFYSGALGAGLAIFSRFPIIAATIHPYSLNGSPIDVTAGDWFVGKAAASVLISHPLLGQVQVFNTHLFAKGGEEGPDYNRAHRLVNAWEFAKLARQSAELGRYVIAAGDFNSVPNTLPMNIIRDHAGLSDAWQVSHPALHTSSTPPSPSGAISAFGVTADSPLNSYSSGKPLEGMARRFGGKRLDYIFFRQPTKPPASDKTPILTCTNSNVMFTDRVPGQEFSFSDHFGLEATFEIRFPAEDVESVYHAEPTMPTAGAQSRGSIAISSTSNISSSVPSSLTAESIVPILQSLTACYRYSKSRARMHLTIFASCIVLLLGLIISSAWLPRSWFSPIFVFAAVVVAWLATTMLYVGFVYGRWEVNALMNVIEELEIMRGGIGTRYDSRSDR
ncbi:hypothetical protein JAAARDRAFT_121142 [Jaapia argillacea MUCL 33604]|uniref:Endonuclease/exonuclease/phosphatase domain-containing protein n=1 Tax=Jaapia argillacea MUCL 33604 TaxID=933084 RepID=A0A067Q7T5_9AGAM|nr:hypothetical protein JAAARDRAFT_121142 [Jaapia argillacea MUCL 33604]